LIRTIYWHDYETFGADPRRDRAVQFAGIRTDEALNIIGEPLLMYCKPAPDMLPHPQACLITGITPQKALAEGLCEAEFIARIHAEFSQAGTCVAGYNSIRFDDELSRQTLYRNFYDPYEREWKNGNSRWDIIDMVRLCAATRPQGIIWPQKDDGSPSFRLELLTAANGIAHANAHDALADVLATIALARLIRDRQPRLYEHIYQLRSKHAVQAQLNLMTHKPVLHVSMMYPATRGCLALVVPLCRHPVDSNGIIVCDLRLDPAKWIDLSVEEFRRLLFTSQQLPGQGEERIPLKVVHLNRCPVLVPAGVLNAELAEKYSVNLSLSQRHWESLCADPVKLAAVLEKVTQVYDRRLLELNAEEEPDLEDDPDYMIYSGGFFSEADKLCMSAVRACPPDSLATLAPRFQDGRLHEMLFRYRARNWPEFLNEKEMQRWFEFCRERLNRASSERAAGLDLRSFRAEVTKMRLEQPNPEAQQILDDIEGYADTLAVHLHLEHRADNPETAVLQ